MGVLKREAAHPSRSPEPPPTKGIETLHAETAVEAEPEQKWKVSRAGDGDVALALFDSPRDVHEPIDPAAERRLVRKIDGMILPYLAVCYAFFYIDKTTLSYAAIFGIKDDLRLTGNEYSWLSSICTWCQRCRRGGRQCLPPVFTC